MKTINPELSATIDNPPKPAFTLSKDIEDAVVIDVDDWKYKATSALKTLGSMAKRVLNKLPSLSKLFTVAALGLATLGIGSSVKNFISDKEIPILMTMCPLEADNGSMFPDFEKVKGSFTIGQMMSVIQDMSQSPNVISSFDKNGNEYVLVDGEGNVNAPALLGFATGIIKAQDSSTEIERDYESTMQCIVNNKRFNI